MVPSYAPTSHENGRACKTDSNVALSYFPMDNLHSPHDDVRACKTDSELDASGVPVEDMGNRKPFVSAIP